VSGKAPRDARDSWKDCCAGQNWALEASTNPPGLSSDEYELFIGHPFIKWESISRIALGDSAERVHEKTDHLDNRLVFISALWVALTTAILCAILPAGLPLTKAVGSAFSPSTTIVALRATAEQVRDTERHFVKGDPERLTNLPLPTSHVDFTIPGVAALERYYTVQGRPAAVLTPKQPLPNTITSPPFPRGPPTA